MIGQFVSHYKILDKLGEGGMGIVYRAHDTKLDRTVALKFLPPQVSATEQDKTRFMQEARAAAALNHPHICHIYRIDEVDAPPASGRQGEKMMFIEMEHVDGLTLRKRIATGPIPLSEALTLATQIGVMSTLPFGAAFATERAERIDTSCSALRPPKMRAVRVLISGWECFPADISDRRRASGSRHR